MMKFTFLGTGTAAPKGTQRPSCIYFEAGEAAGLLDLGAGAIHSLAGQGIDPMTIEHVFLSHFHSDHVSDLILLLHSNNATPGKTREKALHVYGPAGLKHLVETITDLFPETVPETYEIVIHELNTDEPAEVCGFSVSCCRTGHTDYSQGYRFDSAAFSFVYTGDTAYSEKLAAFCRGTDVLITECSYTDDRRTCDHLCVAETGKLAAASEARALIVTHRYPQTAETDILPEIRETYSGPVRIPDDNTCIEM